MKVDKKLIFISNTARDLVEKFALSHPEIGNVKTLTCYCAIGSTILFYLAAKHKYDLTFVQGCFDSSSGYLYSPDYVNHCWVEYKKNIIDITATQFGIKDRVYITNYKKDSSYHPMYLNNNFGFWGNQDPRKYKKSIRELIRSSD